MTNRRINHGARAKARRIARGAVYRNPDLSRGYKAKNTEQLKRLKKLRDDPEQD